MREAQAHHIASVRSDEQKLVARKEKTQLRRAKEEADFLRSLHSCEYEFNKDINPEAVEGTCQWFFGNPKYLSWQTEDSQKLLIVSLGPGCGKSVLARHLINSHTSAPLMRFPDSVTVPNVCYFFFKEMDEHSRNAKDALRAILHQLLVQFPNLRAPTLGLYSSTQHHFTYDATVNLLLEVLALKETGPMIFVIDALDECEPIFRSRFLDELTTLLLKPFASRKLKMIFTCRPQSDITDIFTKRGPLQGHVQIVGEASSEQDAISCAINSFIDNKIDTFQELRARRRGAIDDADTHLRKWLHQHEDRNYLWISRTFLQLEQNAALPLHDLKKIIDTLPDTIEQIYENILMKCSNMEKAQSLLHIVVAAIRPLTAHEINILLSMHECDECLDDVSLIPELCLSKILQELCGFFVNVVNDRVYLHHPTAKEFLQQRPYMVDQVSGAWIWKHSLPTPVSHEKLAKNCLQYLRFADFQKQPLQVEDGFLYHDSVVDRHGWHARDFPEAVIQVEKYVKEHPFLEYAACHWLEHLQLAKGTRDEGWAVSAALEICQINTKIWRTWFTVYISRQRRFASCPYFPSTLSFMSWLGFEVGVVRLLLNTPITPDEKLSALSLASVRRNPNVTKLFFDEIFPRRAEKRSSEQCAADIELAIKSCEMADRKQPCEPCKESEKCATGPLDDE